MKNRRKPTITERLTPCECCGHPISNRHHILDFAKFGETDQVLPFCPNCHELYHICFKAILEPSPRIADLWNGFIARAGHSDRRVPVLIAKVLEAQQARLDLAVQNMPFDTSDFCFETY